MARKRPRDIQQLFGGQRLQRFTDFTEQYQRWQQQLQQCFVALQLSPLLAHCKVVSVRAHTLVLEASSAALASRIKLQQSRIITHFQDGSTGHISRLEVQVRPKINTPSPQPIEKPPQVTQNAGIDENDTVAKLREQAQLCEEPLRSQLLALAEKYEKN